MDSDRLKGCSFAHSAYKLEVTVVPMIEIHVDTNPFLGRLFQGEIVLEKII